MGKLQVDKLDSEGKTGQSADDKVVVFLPLTQSDIGQFCPQALL